MDSFSPGIAIASTASQKLADDRMFKCAASFFAIDKAKAHAAVSTDCLPVLQLDCVRINPVQLPVTCNILECLGAI
jgi:hypothetical protein